MRGAVISLEFESHWGQTWDLSSEILEEWGLKVTLQALQEFFSYASVLQSHSLNPLWFFHAHSLGEPEIGAVYARWEWGKTPVLCNQTLGIHMWILKLLGEIHGCGKRTQMSLTEATFPLHRHRKKRNWITEWPGVCGIWQLKEGFPEHSLKFSSAFKFISSC